MIYCFRGSAFSEQGVAQTIVCCGRLDSQLLLKQIHCLRSSVRLEQDVDQMIVRQPTSRIMSDSRSIKGLRVVIHPALLPGEEEEYATEHQGDSGLEPSVPRLQSCRQ